MSSGDQSSGNFSLPSSNVNIPDYGSAMSSTGPKYPSSDSKQVSLSQGSKELLRGIKSSSLDTPVISRTAHPASISDTGKVRKAADTALILDRNKCNVTKTSENTLRTLVSSTSGDNSMDLSSGDEDNDDGGDSSGQLKLGVVSSISLKEHEADDESDWYQGCDDDDDSGEGSTNTDENDSTKNSDQNLASDSSEVAKMSLDKEEMKEKVKSKELSAVSLKENTASIEKEQVVTSSVQSTVCDDKLESLGNFLTLFL